MDRVQAARWTFRGIALLCFAVALASLGFTLFAGLLELVGGLVTGGIYGAVGFGLWRMKEGAWMLSLIVLGMTAAFELAVVAGSRDWMLLLGASVNVLLIAALIWAGRQLPEPQASSTPAAETPA